MKMKRVDFKSSIDSFHYFFSKKSMNENVDNSKMKHSFLNFNNDLTKTLKETFRGTYNDLNESSSFKNDLLLTTSVRVNLACVICSSQCVIQSQSLISVG